MSFVTGVVIPIVGGILLIAARFTKSESPRWVLNALCLAGAAAVLAGIMALVGGHEYETNRALALVRLRGFLGGLIAGTLLTLAIAGELKFRRSAKNEGGE